MSGHRLIALGACGTGLLGLTALGLYAQAHDNLNLFLAAAVAQSIIYLLSVWMVWNSLSAGPVLFMVIAVAGLARLPVMCAAPYLSSDIYRYIWDGRVEAAGINPYRYIPADPHLEVLRDLGIYPQINRNNYAPTIYPPLAEAIFLGVTRVSESVTAMKAAMVGFEVLTVVILFRLLAESALPSARILVYAWHPLPIWEFAGSGHIDAAMIALIALALWAQRKGWDWLAGLSMAGATVIKLYPAVLGPAIYRRWNWRMPAVFAATVLLAYLPFVGAGWGVFGFLPAYVTEEGFNASGAGFFLWNLLRQLTPLADLPAVTYPIGAAAILAAIAIAVVFARNPADMPFAGAAVLATTFTVLLSPHYPWYFAWLIVFACFSRSLSLLWLTNACLLLYLVPVGSHIAADDHRLIIESLMYGPFAALALIDIWYRRRRTIRSG